jgi:thioredoxin reductase
MYQIRTANRAGSAVLPARRGPQTQLAQQLGVQLCDNGYIAADSEQTTSIPGVYAAGDVTRLHSH